MKKQATPKNTDTNAIHSRKVRLVGKVISDKMTGTIVVEVVRTTRHKLYKKTVRHFKKYKAKNSVNAKLGETVLIEETKPISKDIRFITQKILEGAKLADLVEEEKSDLDLLLGHTEGEQITSDK